jgi:hypothetical protein
MLKTMVPCHQHCSWSKAKSFAVMCVFAIVIGSCGHSVSSWTHTAMQKQRNYHCHQPHDDSSDSSILYSFSCMQDMSCNLKRSLQGQLSAVLMQPSFCKFHVAASHWLAHDEGVKTMSCLRYVTLNWTKSHMCGLQLHAKGPLCSSTTAFFGTMPAATSLCLSWNFWHRMQTWNRLMIVQKNTCFSLWEATLGCAILAIVCIDGIVVLF